MLKCLSGDNMDEVKQSKKSVLLDYLKVIVITLIVTYGVLYFVQISKVYGTSMLPTYHEGNIVLVDKVFYKHNEPKRNDIVVVDYKDANMKETFIIKRVVGIGGDHIEIKDNELYCKKIWKRLCPSVVRCESGKSYFRYIY